MSKQIVLPSVLFSVGLILLIAAFFLFWYTPISPIALRWPHEWVIVLSWCVVGIILLTSSKFADRKHKVTDAEREVLMFGEEYAREIFEKNQ